MHGTAALISIRPGAIIPIISGASPHSRWQLRRSRERHHPQLKPDIVHVHDWQTALTPVYMRFGPAPDLPTVMTIHNIAFQGQFGASVFPELALPPDAFSTQFVEYYGDVGFLKGGLQTASAITRSALHMRRKS